LNEYDEDGRVETPAATTYIKGSRKLGAALYEPYTVCGGLFFVRKSDGFVKVKYLRYARFPEFAAYAL